MADLTGFALDATVPLVRPSSVVRRIVGNLYGIYTPSAGKGPLFMAMGDAGRAELEQMVEDTRADMGYWETYFPADA